MYRYFIGLSFLWFSSISLAQGKFTVEEYIETWKDVAVQQMVEHGIPASITLSQGILESSFGNSYLARKGNNHFGIKCHDWSGETIHKDDDKKNECFRKYKDARESYDDHSKFLTGRSRYGELFQLEITDYKAWAKGLKRAGYATNPKYDRLLIDLIERHGLAQYDQEGILVEPDGKNEKRTEPLAQILSVQKREVKINQNRTRFVVAQEGDTFYRLAKEFGLTLRQLNNYNDFPKGKDVLSPGDIVYVMQKPSRSKKGYQKISITEEMELWQVSQQYGIKLKSLMQRNDITSPTAVLAQGEVVFLR
jgi:LysM repeat protein